MPQRVPRRRCRRKIRAARLLGWTSGGRLRLGHAALLDDPRPVDSACGCETCATYSRAYLAHLFRAGELLVHRLTSVHNLTYTHDLMRAIRQGLRDGGYTALRERVTGQFAARADDAQSADNGPVRPDPDTESALLSDGDE